MKKYSILYIPFLMFTLILSNELSASTVEEINPNSFKIRQGKLNVVICNRGSVSGRNLKLYVDLKGEKDGQEIQKQLTINGNGIGNSIRETGQNYRFKGIGSLGDRKLRWYLATFEANLLNEISGITKTTVRISGEKYDCGPFADDENDESFRVNIKNEYDARYKPGEGMFYLICMAFFCPEPKYGYEGISTMGRQTRSDYFKELYIRPVKIACSLTLNKSGKYCDSGHDINWDALDIWNSQ